MYPHQVLMEEHSLQRKDLTQEAQSYLTDFNHFHNGVSLKEKRAVKKGAEGFAMSEGDSNKLIRFSKSVCRAIYEGMNTTLQEGEKEKVKAEKLKQDSLELKRIQEEEDDRVKAEAEEKKVLQMQSEENERIAEEERVAEEERIAAIPPPPPKEKGLLDYFF
jgi:hypothetical protein